MRFGEDICVVGGFATLDAFVAALPAQSPRPPPSPMLVLS